MGISEDIESLFYEEMFWIITDYIPNTEQKINA